MGRHGIVFFLAGFLLLGGGAWSQGVRHANAFLQVGRDARHEALGRSLGALGYQPMLGGVNPASLGSMAMRHSVGMSYSNQFGGMGLLWSGSYGYRLGGDRGLEAQLVYYGVSDIPNTLGWIGSDGSMDDTRVYRFDVSDYAVLLSYGQGLPVEGLSLGGSLKLIYRHAGGFARGYGVGFEGGVRYSRGAWSVGAVLHDATTTWTFWEFNFQKLSAGEEAGLLDFYQSRAEEVTLPSLSLYTSHVFHFGTFWHLGVAGRVHSVFGDYSGLPLSVGRVGFDPSLGVWLGLARRVELRLGARQFQVYRTHGGDRGLVFAPSGGLGVLFSGLSINYSFSAPLTGASMRFTHLVSISFSFGEAGSGSLPPVEGPADMIRLGDS